MSTEHSRLNYAFSIKWNIVVTFSWLFPLFSIETRNRMHHTSTWALAFSTHDNVQYSTHFTAIGNFDLFHRMMIISTSSSRGAHICPATHCHSWWRTVATGNFSCFTFFSRNYATYRTFTIERKWKEQQRQPWRSKNSEVEVVREKLIIFREVSLFSTLVCEHEKFITEELLGKTTTCRWQ